MFFDNVYYFGSSLSISISFPDINFIITINTDYKFEYYSFNKFDFISWEF